MPATVEAALVLIVLVGPGFIASRLLNSLVPYRAPTAFQETTQALVFSAVMVPIWLMAARPLLSSRNAFLAAWRDHETASQLPWWAVGMPVLVLMLVYFVAAPTLAIAWALLVRKRPHIRFAGWLLERLGSKLRYAEGPEVWDEIFGADEVQKWVRVTFKDGTAVEGLLIGAGLSPSGRQLHLSGLAGIANSLTVLNSDGRVVDDLSARQVEAIWIEIGSEVRRVDVFTS